VDTKNGFLFMYICSDTEMIKSYFQDNCYKSVLQYSKNLKSIIDKIEEDNSELSKLGKKKSPQEGRFNLFIV
jgi:hypothetical protein